MSSKTLWSLDGVNFVHDSKEIAIKALLVADGVINSSQAIFFAEASTPDIEQLVDADGVVAGVKNKAQEIYGDISLDRVHVEAVAVAELKQLLSEWAKKSISTFFYVTGESTPYYLTEEDLVLVETPEQRRTRKEAEFLLSIEVDFPADMDEASKEFSRQGALKAYRKIMPV